MKLSFRNTLIFLALTLSVLSTGIMAYFTIELFREEKITLLFEHELSNTRRLAGHLESLVHLASVMEVSRAAESAEILFLYEDPCNRASPIRGAVARSFQRQFEETSLSPSHWIDGLDVHRACLQLRELPAEKRVPIPVRSEIQIMVPYFLTLIPSGERTRLAMISMEGFDTTSFSTLLILDSAGRTLWSADSEAYVRSALSDSGLSAGDLKKITEDTIERGALVDWAGSAGLISTAVTEKTGWIMTSLSYRPAILTSIQFTLRQMMILSAAVFFLVFFLGKKGAEYLAKPFRELQSSAEQIGAGKFDLKLGNSALHEISVVYDAFRLMAEKISQLIQETKKRAMLQSELALAQQVQKLLFPPAQVITAGHRIHSYAKSAEMVSGDWWGYLPIARPNRKPCLLLLIGDVTDHGAASALVAATVKGATSLLAAWVRENPTAAADPRNILTHLNAVVFDAARSTLQMTLLAAVLDIEEKKIHCSNAAHTFPYLLTGNKCLSIVGGGISLGQDPKSAYTAIETRDWNVGDRIFMYSDGLITCYRGEDSLFNRKEVVQFLKNAEQIPSADLIRRLMAHRSHITGNLPEADDVTALVCEATGDWDG